MAGRLEGRRKNEGLLSKREARGLLSDEGVVVSPEDMSASVSTIPADSGFLSKLANALATMPTVQSIKSAVTLPGDVYAGRQPMGLPSETEDLTRVADLAGLAMTGGVAGAPKGALGAGPYRGTGYHGSPRKDLAQVLADPAERQFDNATSQFGGFFAPVRDGAKRYAGKDGQIYKAELDLANPYEMPVSEFLRFQAPNKGPNGESLPGELWAARAEELKGEAAALRARLAEAGHDGVVMRRSDGSVMEIASFKDTDVTLGSTSTDRKSAGMLAQGLLGNREPIRAYHGSPHEELAAALRDGGPAVSSKAMPEFETIFRGENSGNKGGSYYSTDRDWARQFTQSGLDKEVKARKISKADIYEAPELPRAVDELAMDRAMAEAKERGFKAIRVDEGRGEPPSVFILDKSALKL
jgi:hypothetical protein